MENSTDSSYTFSPSSVLSKIFKTKGFHIRMGDDYMRPCAGVARITCHHRSLTSRAPEG